jgi:hypothetical protein
MSEEGETLKWFVCLITLKKRVRFEKEKEELPSSSSSSSTHKKPSQSTVIIATWAPERLLYLMNTNEDTRLKGAAENALRELHTSACLRSNHPVDIDVPARFETVFELGPFESEEDAKAAVAYFETSRGHQPRTVFVHSYAQAQKFKMFYIHWQALYQVDAPIEVIHTSLDGGTKLRFITSTK